MSILGHIGVGIDKEMITAIVAAGQGQAITQKLCEAPGVLSISHHHARGVGSKRLRTGQLFFDERDVLLILVEAEHGERIFREVFEAGRIGEPGGGLIFSEKVLRGHPMMPFAGADW